MCGITGMYLREAVCDEQVLTKMRDIVAHRGPDDAGNFIEGPVGLGHRRLSIIDLGTGQQPMATSDGHNTIVFNGEIYNYRELRRELEARGVTFKTQSDTEVILQVHSVFGDSGVQRLNGIFAYALWDRKRRRLLLARDRMGIKPLYYAVTRRGFIFGSEIKSLFQSGLLKPELNSSHVAEFLVFRQVAEPETLFVGVLSVPPGHTLAVSAGGVSELRAYWRIADNVASFAGDYDQAVDAVDFSLKAAVRRQMIADVPLGTFCSGGIDSSLTTAIAARHSSAPINTYSVGFSEPEYDESRFARLAARTCGSQHHEIVVSEARFVELLPRLIWHHDLPLHFANSVHIFAVSELARNRVKVVLTGEGADELFGGYPRYAFSRLTAVLDRVPAILRSSLLLFARHLPDHRTRKLAKLALATPEERLLFNSAPVDPNDLERILNRPVAASAWKYRMDLVARAGDVSRIDLETYLVAILNRQDKMSMATGLEARVPFLDNEIVDLAHALPQEFKHSIRHRKRVLKDVARRYLPGEIVDRRKSGFGVPLAQWMKGNGAMSTLVDEVSVSGQVTELFERESVVALVGEHRSGREDHSELLWGLVNFALWRQSFSC